MRYRQEIKDGLEVKMRKNRNRPLSGPIFIRKISHGR